MYPKTRFSLCFFSTLLFVGLGCTEKSSSTNSVANTDPTQDWTKLKDFDSVNMASPDHVRITLADSFSVRVEADEKVRKELRIEQKGKTLRIYRDAAIGQESTEPAATIHLSMPTLNEISVAGSGNAEIGKLEGDSLEVNIAGSGNINIASASLNEMEANIAGSGDIKLQGKTNALDLSVAGSGTFDAANLEVKKGDVNMAGSGKAHFSSNGEVKGNIIGSGTVHVKGNAKCESVKLGSGEMTCGS